MLLVTILYILCIIPAAGFTKYLKEKVKIQAPIGILFFTAWLITPMFYTIRVYNYVEKLFQRR